MSEFRTGNKAKSHPYPTTPRFGGPTSGPFARNSALAVEPDPLAITVAGITLSWGNIESSGGAGVNVPITPKQTGRIILSGTFLVENSSGGAQTVTVQLKVGLNTFTVAEMTVDPAFAGPNNGMATVAFDFAYVPPATGAPLAVGVTTNIQALLSATADNTLSLIAGGIIIQEVSPPTG